MLPLEVGSTAKPVMSSLASSIEIVDSLIARVEKLVSGEAAEQNTGSNTTPPTVEKKKKQEEKHTTTAVPAVSDAATQFLTCDLRVGKVITVAHHPEADGLFHLSVHIGSGETRSVCAGLRNFLADSEMEGRLVVLICNLKPRKLRGINSEAMCLAGSVSNDGGKDTVVPIAPPGDATAGAFVGADGIIGERSVVDGKFVNSKTWDKVSSRFTVKNGIACYDGMPMCTASGSRIECALPDGAEIH